MLEEANRYYWIHNLPAACRLYERTEKQFEQAHDERNELYAKVGLVRSELQMPFGAMSDFLAVEMEMLLAKSDPSLRLWFLGVQR